MRFRLADAVRACAMVMPLLLSAAAHASFVTFETGQVRPLALSPDGAQLFAVNTPDNALEVFDVDGGGLTRVLSVPVGLEPCAVAARTNSEVWVVNHLSDSISVVDLSLSPPRVVRTLLVGDEPRDIVFGGSGGNRAFITTAHRGQNDPNDPQLTIPGIGRADVWVFDATNLGSSLGGTPVAKLTLFGDTPRALAVSPDGSTVYAAVFHSGNQTTAVSEGAVCNGPTVGTCNVFGTTMPGGLPGPNTNFSGDPRPDTGLIVKYNNGASQWRDQLSRNWNPAVRFSLPDYDVFQIDADAVLPVETASFAHVGTVLFNMIVNPMNGNLYVSNTEARNEVRFEGPGIFGGSTVRSHLAETRVTVIDPVAPTVAPRHLNKHINYAVVPSAPGVEDDSLATPVGMAVSGDGATLYVAAFGSSKVGVYPTAALENDSFNPSAITHIQVSGGGPSGVALDEANDRLYVLTRFNNAVAVVNTNTQLEEDSLPLHNPEPHHVVVGRPLLYDARETSSNGEASCSSCHIAGDFDSLAWDLGNPDDETLNNPNNIRVPAPGDVMTDFHPMKGPMTTQSLRGMANHGPMHWRGDRTGGNDEGGSSFDEDAAFKKFNGAFEGLLGREAPLTDGQMQQFTDFILDVMYPPNPIRALDNSLTPDQQAGRNFYFGPLPSDVFQPCNGCHRLNVAQGFFGSDGFSSFENEPQVFKIAHLRNAYQKVGMFGMPAIAFLNSGNNGNQGPQVRGTGFLHDGSIDTVVRFLNATVFNQVQFGMTVNPGGFQNGAAGDPMRRQVERFILAFDSDLKPVVGQQITLSSSNSATVGPRIDLFIARDTAGDCDVVVKGTLAGEQRGWYRAGAGNFLSDRVAEGPISDAALRALASSTDLTYSCVPPGQGYRIAVDRDMDGSLDADELDALTDPADPASEPPNSVYCMAAITVDKPNLRVSKNELPAGDERFVMSGFVQSARNGPALDPVGSGFGIKVLDANGATLLTRRIPPGASVDNGPGWKVNSQGTRWRYKDSAGSVGGVISVSVVDKARKSPGLYQFRVSGKENDFRIDPVALPLQVVVVLGDGVQTANEQCATIEFNAPDVRPYCSAGSDGNSVRCR